MKHDLSMRLVHPQVQVKNNFNSRGCMALTLAFGPLLGLGVKPSECLKLFNHNLTTDKRFHDALLDEHGKCKNVAQKTYVLSKMRVARTASYNGVTYKYEDVLAMSRVINIADSKLKNTHFVMIIPNFQEERFCVYDPAFSFTLDDIEGLLRYYKVTSKREFRQLRKYPFNA